MFINLGSDPLILKYQGMIFSLAAKYTTHPQEYEELVSAGILGLLEAKKSFRKNRGSKLSTWIFIHARKRIQDQKNSSLLIKISPATALKKPIILTKLTNSCDRIDYHTPFDILAEKEDEIIKARKISELFVHLNKKFNSLERKVIIDYYVNNKTMRWLDVTYKLNSFKIIERVNLLLRNNYGLGGTGGLSVA